MNSSRSRLWIMKFHVNYDVNVTSCLQSTVEFRQCALYRKSVWTFFRVLRHSSTGTKILFCIKTRFRERGTLSVRHFDFRNLKRHAISKFLDSASPTNIQHKFYPIQDNIPLGSCTILIASKISIIYIYIIIIKINKCFCPCTRVVITLRVNYWHDV